MTMPFTPDQVAHAYTRRHHGAAWRLIAAELGLLGRDDLHALILAVHDAHPHMTVTMDDTGGDQ